jgi:hypothetical protein
MKTLTLILTAISLILLFITSGETAPEQDLVLYFDFEKIDGDVIKEQSGNNNDGTIHGGAKLTKDGKFGFAMEFDGIDDYITVADSPGLDITDEFTLSIWISTKQNISGFWVAILGKHFSSTDGSYLLFIGENGPNQVCFYAVNSAKQTGYLVPGVTINNGDWHHAAGVYDGSEMRLYIDGVMKKNVALKKPVQLTDHPITIAKRTDGGNYFNGKVDDAAIFKRALPEDKLKRIMEKGVMSAFAVEFSCKLAASWGAIKANH